MSIPHVLYVKLGLCNATQQFIHAVGWENPLFLRDLPKSSLYFGSCLNVLEYFIIVRDQAGQIWGHREIFKLKRQTNQTIKKELKPTQELNWRATNNSQRTGIYCICTGSAKPLDKGKRIKQIIKVYHKPVAKEKCPKIYPKHSTNLYHYTSKNKSKHVRKSKVKIPTPSHTLLVWSSPISC